MNRTTAVLAVVGTITLLGAGAAQAAPLTEDGVYSLTAAAMDGSPGVTSPVVVDSVNAVGGTTGTSDDSTSAAGELAAIGLDSAVLLWGASGIGALGLGAGSIVVARRRSAEA